MLAAAYGASEGASDEQGVDKDDGNGNRNYCEFEKEPAQIEQEIRSKYSLKAREEKPRRVVISVDGARTTLNIVYHLLRLEPTVMGDGL